MDKRIDEDVFWWFGCVERMEKDRIAKRIYVEESAGSHSVGRLWKRWIDIVKNCLREIELDIKQPRRMVHDKSECQG